MPIRSSGPAIFAAMSSSGASSWPTTYPAAAIKMSATVGVSRSASAAICSSRALAASWAVGTRPAGLGLPLALVAAGFAGRSTPRFLELRTVLPGEGVASSGTSKSSSSAPASSG